MVRSSTTTALSRVFLDIHFVIVQGIIQTFYLCYSYRYSTRSPCLVPCLSCSWCLVSDPHQQLFCPAFVSHLLTSSFELYMRAPQWANTIRPSS